MKVLVISHQHGLLPLTWRLQQEGAEVDLIIDRDSYERAWRGRFDQKLHRIEKRRRHNMKAVRAAAEEDGKVVITDDPRWASVFEGYPNLYAMVERPQDAPRLPAQLIGAWFDGEDFSGRHLLAEDQGLWPGGMGPDMLGGLTLIKTDPDGWPETFEDALQRIKDELKAKGYRGLVKVGTVPKARDETLPLDPSNPPELIVTGYQAGWNWLQAHALLAEAGDFATPRITDILEGSAPCLWHRFTVVVPVSIPPYPHRAAAAQSAPKLVIPEAAAKCGQVYWHDMMVEDGVVKTAGLDGLVGVVRASANSLSLARGQALMLAKLFTLPELQVRVDVGGGVDRWLAWLEEVGLPV